jgi:hypothetical protein
MIPLITDFLRNGLKDLSKNLRPKTRSAGYSGAAVLIFDSCTAHDGDDFGDLSLRQNVMVILILVRASS